MYSVNLQAGELIKPHVSDSSVFITVVTGARIQEHKVLSCSASWTRGLKHRAINKKPMVKLNKQNK